MSRPSWITLWAALTMLVSAAMAQQSQQPAVPTRAAPTPASASATLPAPVAIADATACTALARDAQLTVQFAQIPDAPTTIDSARLVPARGDGSAWEKDLPEMCRVQGFVAPSVGFVLRLPTSNWNGKFIMGGCGGPCGTFLLDRMTPAVVRGYAAVVTDMGHQGGGWMFAYNNPQGQIDHAYRATHVTAVASKVIVEAFYARKPARNYFYGCSTGGRQGMVAAQRFPEDFDGILAGSPPWNQTGVRAYFMLGSARANLDANRKPILDARKLPLIHDAVLAACDAADGLKDGVLQNPLACSWDPSTIQCATNQSGVDPSRAGQSGSSCLTAAEVGVVRRIHNGTTNSAGVRLHRGMPRGSELKWAPVFVDHDGRPGAYLGGPGGIGNVSYNYMSFFYPPGPGYSGLDFDYDRDPPRLALTEYLWNAENPDLSRFKARGGKLILYHGWDDNQIPGGASVDYYETATRTMGGEAATREFFRLFMLPATDHCRYGIGGAEVDWLTALENWVEKGQAPDAVIAHRMRTEPYPSRRDEVGHGGDLLIPRFPLEPGSYDRARPIYPWPDAARYAGKGDPDDPASWHKAPRPKSGGR